MIATAATFTMFAMFAGALAAPQPVNGSAKLKVYIMMGQSNMLGMGTIGTLGAKALNGSLAYAVQEEGKYPYLYDKAAKNWTTSKTMRNVFVMGSGGPKSATDTGRDMTNAWMTGAGGHGGKIGPELGIGGMLEAKDPSPTMLLKSCIGNRGLGWDLLPTGSKSFDFTDPKTKTVYTYAGFGQSPSKWVKGTTPKPIGWTAGCQYVGDQERAKSVLTQLPKYCPGSTDYEIAGFFWWQGDRDSRDLGYTEQYEKNLVQLIKQLRIEYKAPNAPFVTASLGQSTLPVSGCLGNCGGGILQAMINVADPKKYPEFKGNVAMVDSHKYDHDGGSSGGHYGHNPETYMDVGQAMGTAMVGMMK